MLKNRTYLNLGCGGRYHSDWINIDVRAVAPDVTSYDLSRGIPLADGSCDVVYHSHLLEHLRHADALPFLIECYRVLKPGGGLRVAVPDLERICSLYLEKLRLALAGDPTARCDYEWMLLELYDQALREQSGGMMLAYLNQDSIPNETFVFHRIGQEGKNLVHALRENSAGTDHLTGGTNGKPISAWLGVCRRLRAPLTILRDAVLTLVLGTDGLRALKTVRFRLSGEAHQWMYDRYSLVQLLLSAGFEHTVLQTADRSSIPNWNDFHLDTLPDGTIIKPDSLFVECVKPSPHSVEGQYAEESYAQ